ncbi:MAG: F0F1 ATP synthase subunit B [Neisseriaceae bacterium]|nr:MAG: F0F1 ATP synthase subunit B [Neisseriaceae bacterium]
MDINATLIGQAITFIILVLFTMKFVWPPLNGMLEERAKRIADGLAAAEEGKKQLLNAESKVADELKKVHARANEIVANAEKLAHQTIDDAKLKAQLEADKIIANAKSQLEQDLFRMREDLRQQVSDLVIKGAEQVVRAEIDKSRHEKLLAQLKAEL